MPTERRVQVAQAEQEAGFEQPYSVVAQVQVMQAVSLLEPMEREQEGVRKAAAVLALSLASSVMCHGWSWQL